MQTTTRIAAQGIIWAFFLLIFSKVFEMAAQKLGSPVRPVLVYAATCALAGALGASAIWRGGFRISTAEIAYFASFAALAVLMLAGYSGEQIGPDFGHRLIHPLEMHIKMPSNISYAIWPALNFAMASSLFLFARTMNLWSTILCAALAAFALQIVTMLADITWPGAFGLFPQVTGRAAGLARNANSAAVMIACLVALYLPVTPYERLSKRALCTLLVAIPAFVAAGSRMGWLLCAVLIVIALLAQITAARSGRVASFFLAAFVAVPIITLLAPSLAARPEVAQSPPMTSAIKMSSEDTEAQQHPQGALPTMLIRRIGASLDPQSDPSLKERLDDFLFFLRVALDHPLGLGTGFSNKYEIGPHNTALKLWVDNGLAAAALYLGLLLIMTCVAIMRRSPALSAFSLIAIIVGNLSHTTFVEPQVFVLFAAVLGAITRGPDAPQSV
jgi:hypothetical protein